MEMNTTTVQVLKAGRYNRRGSKYLHEMKRHQKFHFEAMPAHSGDDPRPIEPQSEGVPFFARGPIKGERPLPINSPFGN